MSTQNKEPTVYYCEKEQITRSGVRFGPVKRDTFLIESCKKGSSTMLINGRKFKITPRSAYFIMPGDVVTYLNDDKEIREGYFSSVEGDIVAETLLSVGITSESPFAPPELFDEIHELLKMMYVHRDEADTGAELRQIGRLYSILGSLLRSKKLKSTDNNIWIKKAIGYMETHYPEEITVSSLAEHIGLDRTYFSTLFKSRLGVSPYAYLTSLRIKKAAALIDAGGYTMNDIAEAVGLDPQNFARVFRREMGMKPNEYKRK